MSGWLELPTVTSVDPGPQHWQTLQRLLERSGAAGNLTNDAHLAAIATDRGCLLCSADNDFHRFDGLQFHNPLDPGGVREPALVYASRLSRLTTCPASPATMPAKAPVRVTSFAA